jgi:predicted transcriptional regulator
MKEKLQQIGLNPTEIEIYLTLLEHGKITPSNISRITGINRSTTYAAADELKKKGIIEEDLSGKTKYLIALPPERLNDYIERKINELKRQENLVKSIIPELDLLPKSGNYSIPKVQFIDGPDIEEFLYKKTPVWEQSMRDINEKTWWGFQDHTFVENPAFLKWIMWYWKRSKDDIDLKLFSNQSEIEESMKAEKLSRRQLKLWSGDNFTSTQLIMGEYIVSIVTRERLQYLVQIRDRVLAESMRNFAKKLWSKE